MGRRLKREEKKKTKTKRSEAEVEERKRKRKNQEQTGPLSFSLLFLFFRAFAPPPPRRDARVSSPTSSAMALRLGVNIRELEGGVRVHRVRELEERVEKVHGKRAKERFERIYYVSPPPSQRSPCSALSADFDAGAWRLPSSSPPCMT